MKVQSISRDVPVWSPQISKDTLAAILDFYQSKMGTTIKIYIVLEILKCLMNIRKKYYSFLGNIA